MIKKQYWGVAIAAALMCVACDDNSGTIGIPSVDDAIQATSSSFYFNTRSILLDSVQAGSSKSYLGMVHDPQSGTDIKAEFAAQFHCFEDYKLPAENMLVKGDDGQVVADSAEIRLYFTDCYGDMDNPIKVSVYELDTNRVMREDYTYYSNLRLENYLPDNAQPLVTKVFSPEDYTISDEQRTSSSHTNNVRFVLPISYGTRILRQAVKSPQYFKDSWQFIHHVCPGFYFKYESGKGTMLTLDVSTLNIYFKYRENDSTYVGMSRFAATTEVIQSTRIENQGFENLLTEGVNYTYIKSPAGVGTEVTLPIDSIYLGHDNDSVSLARLILTRYNNNDVSDYNLSVPSTLLMVRKQEVHSFFSDHRVADGRTAFTTSFSSKYNTYTFANISRLIAFCHTEKRRIMREQGLTSEQYNQAYPEWNKAVIVPVVVRTITDPNTQAKVQVSVTHDFSLSSTRLVGGTIPQPLQIIYSTYRNE